MGRYDDHVVTDAADYFAKWGPKGFKEGPDIVVPFRNLRTSFALKEGNNHDTSGTEPTNTTGRQVQTVTFETTYAKYLGTDPKDQMHQWYDLMEDVWPFYIGGEQFGPPLLQLQSVDWKNYQITSNEMLAVDATITLREWWDGIEEDEGWLNTPDDSSDIFTGDIFNSGLSNAQQIWLFLRQHGFSAAAAAGVMGNMAQEVGDSLNPDTNEIGGYGGYGLCQWTFERKTNLINWCNSNGYDYRTIEGQLNFLLYELEQPYYQQYLSDYKNITDVWTATDRWLTYFEGATVRNETVNWNHRINAANEFYNQLLNYTGPTTTTGAGGSADTYGECPPDLSYAMSSTPFPGNELCATWVSQVFQKVLGTYYGGNGNGQIRAYAHSSNLADLKPGMIIGDTWNVYGYYGPSCGHVAIYVGGGIVYSSEQGGIQTYTLDQFLSTYGPPNGSTVTWGWMGNTPLS